MSLCFQRWLRRKPRLAMTRPPRYETANRQQVELQPCDLEPLLPPGHAARLVWRFVEGLDLTALYAAIKAREDGPGRPAIDPKILMCVVVVRHHRRGRQRTRVGSPVLRARRLSVYSRRGLGELPHAR